MKKYKLHKIEKTGFKTPKDYFESFEEKLMLRLNDEAKFEDIESTGFKTPDGYFDAVDTEILNKLQTENKTKVISLFSKKGLYYISGIAASLLVLFTVLLNNNNTKTLSVDIVQTYLAESDLDSYDLAELLSETDILEEDFTIIQTPINPDNIESYLLENADLEAIIE